MGVRQISSVFFLLSFACRGESVILWHDDKRHVPLWFWGCQRLILAPGCSQGWLEDPWAIRVYGSWAFATIPLCSPIVIAARRAATYSLSLLCWTKSKQLLEGPQTAWWHPPKLIHLVACAAAWVEFTRNEAFASHVPFLSIVLWLACWSALAWVSCCWVLTKPPVSERSLFNLFFLWKLFTQLKSYPFSSSPFRRVPAFFLKKPLAYMLQTKMLAQL